MPVPGEQACTLVHESAAMDVTVHHVGPVAVLTVTGEIDMLTAPAFARCVLAQIAAAPQHLVVDLTSVSFFGSHGIRTLLGLTPPATTLHVAVGDNRLVWRTLEITGLTELVGVHLDTEALVAELTRGRAQRAGS
jgi:anti-sigma B factor antagonist